MDLRNIRAITFDCYGTLIDWESGLLSALAPLFANASVPLDREAVLQSFASHERDIEAGPYRTYREVLKEVLTRMAAEFQLRVPLARKTLLADSIRDWPAFDETPTALRALKPRFRLAVLSNIDDDLFNAPNSTRSRLGVELDELITAQQLRSYKPSTAHFDEALRRLNLNPSQILHVAESRYHDIAPAKALGFPTAWINRHPTGAASASGTSGATPDLEAPDLTTLVQTMQSQSSNTRP